MDKIDLKDAELFDNFGVKLDNHLILFMDY